MVNPPVIAPQTKQTLHPKHLSSNTSKNQTQNSDIPAKRRTNTHTHTRRRPLLAWYCPRQVLSKSPRETSGKWVFKTPGTMEASFDTVDVVERVQVCQTGWLKTWFTRSSSRILARGGHETMYPTCVCACTCSCFSQKFVPEKSSIGSLKLRRSCHTKNLRSGLFWFVYLEALQKGMLIATYKAVAITGFWIENKRYLLGTTLRCYFFLL